MTEESKVALERRFSVAPMLDWTDRHCRYFYRLMTKKAWLYTEMVTTGAIIYGKDDFLRYNEQEHPVALQLGGSDPEAMAQCAKLAEERGYDEVNINVGCPSDRVQNGRFGACLMKEPETVAACITAMKKQVSIPVTVKSRIGIDDMDDYAFLTHFIDTVKDSGCDTFIIHARKAWLKGLSPKQNREIPPLLYDRVYDLKLRNPELFIELNGGIKDIPSCLEHLLHVDSVMLGREVYQNPFILNQVDKTFHQGEQHFDNPHAVVEAMFDYIENEMTKGTKMWHIVRHMVGMFPGMPGARLWRRHLSENATKKDADLRVLQAALAHVPRDIESAA
ncbi:tRNA dihydrouridine(20/20a) synthase DusA [Algicola sagamiensis]|uniref:tRNA dihydrouridine(20/20a) synthase DusA n=1 Tax=Algicola sagamiensis TaxID=163869 RepID=UPI00037183AF|nr:tRNA dihydrouridine(20/20a) synthase DusA [Algicola sagamiensis]